MYAKSYSSLTQYKQLCPLPANLEHSRRRTQIKLNFRRVTKAYNLLSYPLRTSPLFKQNQILPIDEMIKFAALKFMHNYANNRLPFSFNEVWLQNRDINPNRVLRNANDLKVPSHHLATVKRFPFFTFPRIWNEESDRKYNPSIKLYCNQLKSALLAALPP